MREAKVGEKVLVPFFGEMKEATVKVVRKHTVAVVMSHLVGITDRHFGYRKSDIQFS